MDKVILVDEQDKEIGTMEKMEAHQKGKLHRAFSVLVFNAKGEMLIQKRAKTKYHSGGLWTNACCSHPVPDENIYTTVRNRLNYEMGIGCVPTFLYKFIYKTDLDHQLIEYEMDHVFIAQSDDKPILNLEEAEDWKYLSIHELNDSIKANPQLYTYWFKLIVNHPEVKEVTVKS
jgi:isopentenyl-diphosphate Delta-isomerase